MKEDQENNLEDLLLQWCPEEDSSIELEKIEKQILDFPLSKLLDKAQNADPSLFRVITNRILSKTFFSFLAQERTPFEREGLLWGASDAGNEEAIRSFLEDSSSVISDLAQALLQAHEEILRDGKADK